MIQCANPSGEGGGGLNLECPGVRPGLIIQFLYNAQAKFIDLLFLGYPTASVTFLTEETRNVRVIHSFRKECCNIL